MSEGIGMPTILPLALNVLVAAIPPPVPTMNLTTKTIGTMLNHLLELENRANKHAKEITLEKEMQQKVINGLRPHV